MKAWAEAGGALALALAAHLAAFALIPGPRAATGAGEGGADLVHLAAADAALAALVATWDRPPQLAAPAPAPAMPALAAPPAWSAVLPRPDPAPVAGPAPVAVPLAPAPPPLPDLAPLAPADLAPPPPLPAPPQPAPAEGAPSLPDPPRVAAPPPRPAPPPQPVARPAQPAQKAAGAGGGAAAGNRGKAAASTEARASRDDLRAAWGAAIRARIERQKSYPPAARGAVGKVVVLVTVAPSGALVAARVAASSGHAALDEAALRAARAAAPFPPAPQGATVEAVSFRISVNFAR